MVSGVVGPFSDDYFRRELQALINQLGRFSGELVFTLNGGRGCKLEVRAFLTKQCVNQGRDEWSGPDGQVAIEMSGVTEIARAKFETPLRQREGDFAALFADFNDGRLKKFQYIGKGR